MIVSHPENRLDLKFLPPVDCDPTPAAGSGAADDLSEKCWAAVQALPDSISGKGGHPATFRAACECFKWGLSDEQAFNIMQRFSEEKCKPPWTEKELRHKLDDARKRVQKEKATGIRLREKSKGKDAPKAAPAKPFDPADELDIGNIIRPELFLTDAVAGISVPVLSQADGTPRGQWVTYLQRLDGRRERVDLQGALSVPNGKPLIVHPIPGPPAATQKPAWSAGGRKAWTEGAPAPDGAALYRQLSGVFGDYLDFPPDKASGYMALLALFTMLTYCYPAWDAVPYLYIGGPAGSGKSRVFELLEALAFRPLKSSNMTAPTLFRTLHDRGGMLLLDEAERLRESTPDMGEIRSILLAGYKRGGTAQRLKPETFDLQEFAVYGPKAVACINGLPGALLSRCIQVMMFRCPDQSAKPKLRLSDEGDRFQQIRDDLHAWALGNAAAILSVSREADVCQGMTGRHYELWQPLLALAALVDGWDVHALLRRFADDLNGETREDATPDVDAVVLRALAELIRQNQTPQAKDVLARAKLDEPELFNRYSSKGISNVLKKYGLRTVSTTGKHVYRLSWAELRKIQNTYHIDLNLPPEAPQ